MTWSRPAILVPVLLAALLTRALLGKPRAEVLALFGPPDPFGYFRDWDLVYWLGPERGYIGIDSEWLGLRLDEAERVVEVRILADRAGRSGRPPGASSLVGSSQHRSFSLRRRNGRGASV